MYKRQGPTMRRVYYSGYISVNTYDKRLPALKHHNINNIIVMNPIDTPLFTAKDVYTALNAIRERLDALAKLPTDSGSVVDVYKRQGFG